MSSSVVVDLISLHLGEVASCDDDDKHEEDEYDHDVDAELGGDLHLIARAPAIDAAITDAL